MAKLILGKQKETKARKKTRQGNGRGTNLVPKLVLNVLRKGIGDKVNSYG